MVSSVLAKAQPVLESGLWPVLRLPELAFEQLAGRGPGCQVVQRCALLLYCAADVLDDYQDGELPASWQIFGPPNAINAGQALFSLAVLALDPDLLGEGLASRLRTNLLIASIAMAQGQCLDLDASRRSAELARYEKAVLGKTGASSGFCCMAGAMAAGATTEQALLFHRIGEQLGVFVQVLNDLSDLRNPRKRLHPNSSLPLIYLGTQGSVQQQQQLQAWFAGDGADRQELLRLLNGSGAMGYAALRLRLIRRQIGEALGDPSLDDREFVAWEQYLDELEEWLGTKDDSTL